MSFDVYKHLRPGFIRFRMDPQRHREPDAGDTRFSTGPRGEFLARHREGLVFDEPSTGASTASIRSTTRRAPAANRFERWFRTTEDPKSTWITFGLVCAGVILVLLGILVLVRKGPAGWIEVILGAGLIAGPYVVAAKQRRDERLRLEREAAEREADEQALRERVGEVVRLTDSIEELPDDARLAEIDAERRRFDVPYEAFGPLARKAAMRAAFDGIHRINGIDEQETGRRIDQLCAALGMTHEDTRSVKQRICRRLAWHLIADGRMIQPMQQRLVSVAEAMGLRSTDFGSEWSVAEEFQRTRGLTFRSLPKKTTDMHLNFGEVLHHRTTGAVMKPSEVRPISEADYKRADESWLEDGRCDVWVTSKKIRITGDTTAEIDYSDLMGIEIDADHSVLILTTPDRKVVSVQLSDPYYTATVIDYASEADRPKLFGLGPLDRRPTM